MSTCRNDQRQGLTGGCTATQCHRQSPKGQRISDMTLIGHSRHSAYMPLSCVKLHSSVSDFSKRFQRSPATQCGRSILHQSRPATLSIRNPHQCKIQLKERAFGAIAPIAAPRRSQTFQTFQAARDPVPEFARLGGSPKHLTGQSQDPWRRFTG